MDIVCNANINDGDQLEAASAFGKEEEESGVDGVLLCGGQW